MGSKAFHDDHPVRGALGSAVLPGRGRVHLVCAVGWSSRRADLAVTNIVLSIEMLAFLPMVGMSIATSTLVGEYIGRKNLALAEKCVYSALKLAMAYSIFFAVLYLVVPETFLSFFAAGKADVSDAAMMTKGVILLRLVAIYTLFDNMFIVFSGALKGAGDTRFAMWTQIRIVLVPLRAGRGPSYRIHELGHHDRLALSAGVRGASWDGVLSPISCRFLESNRDDARA